MKPPLFAPGWFVVRPLFAALAIGSAYVGVIALIDYAHGKYDAERLSLVRYQPEKKGNP